MTDMRVISRARIFEQLNRQQIENVWSVLSPRKKELKKGDLFIEDGQHVSFCGIVESGELSANKLYADGYLSLLLKFVPSYTIGADIAATKKRISSYFVTALTDSVVWIMDYDKIARPGSLPEAERLLMMESILALIAGENIRKMNKIEIISRKGIRDRILTYLTLESGFYQSTEFDIPFNREEMADFLCLNRSKLSHELSLMQQEGLIKYRKNHFKIMNPDYCPREVQGFCEYY